MIELFGTGLFGLAAGAALVAKAKGSTTNVARTVSQRRIESLESENQRLQRELRQARHSLERYRRRHRRFHHEMGGSRTPEPDELVLGDTFIGDCNDDAEDPAYRR